MNADAMLSLISSDGLENTAAPAASCPEILAAAYDVETAEQHAPSHLQTPTQCNSSSETATTLFPHSKALLCTDVSSSSETAYAIPHLATSGPNSLEAAAANDFSEIAPSFTNTAILVSRPESSSAACSLQMARAASCIETSAAKTVETGATTFSSATSSLETAAAVSPSQTPPRADSFDVSKATAASRSETDIAASCSETPSPSIGLQVITAPCSEEIGATALNPITEASPFSRDIGSASVRRENVAVAPASLETAIDAVHAQTPVAASLSETAAGGLITNTGAVAFSLLERASAAVSLETATAASNPQPAALCSDTSGATRSETAIASCHLQTAISASSSETAVATDHPEIAKICISCPEIPTGASTLPLEILAGTRSEAATPAAFPPETGIPRPEIAATATIPLERTTTASPSETVVVAISRPETATAVSPSDTLPAGISSLTTAAANPQETATAASSPDIVSAAVSPSTAAAANLLETATGGSSSDTVSAVVSSSAIAGVNLPETTTAASASDTVSVGLPCPKTATASTHQEIATAASFPQTVPVSIFSPETITNTATSCSGISGATVQEAGFAAAPGAEFSSSSPCNAVSSEVLQQQERTADHSRRIMNERRKRDRPIECPVAIDNPLGAAHAPRSSVGVETASHGGDTSNGRPQRPRRAPRKFDIENADPDASLKKALEKSLLNTAARAAVAGGLHEHASAAMCGALQETRRMEVDYASLPSIPEIKISSFDEFLVNPVAFYERLERYGREYGGVKVVPPEGWKPPFSLHDLLDDELEFNVRAQDIHKLMQGAKFRHPAEPERASGLQAKDREMKQRLFGTEKPVLQEIEILYWQSVETSSPELTVHYAADLKTNELGSGFPTDKEKKWRVPQGKTAYSSTPTAAFSGSLNVKTTETCDYRLSPDDSKESRRCAAARVLHTREATKKELNERERQGGEEALKAGGTLFLEERKDVKAEGNAQEEEIEGKERIITVSADSCIISKEKAESAQEEYIEKEREDASVGRIATGDETSSNAVAKENQNNVKKITEAFPVKGEEESMACMAGATEMAKETAFYAWHPWNLTRFARQQGSLLSSYHKDVAGVTSPWLYVGMVFSTFCWHAEDNYFAACNYHHWGDAKVWYIIPPSRAPSVERMLQRYLNTKDSDYVLHSLTVQLPPSLFIQHRIPVYRVEQKENEFIILWPRTYHAGFNAGFNCNEACNFAPASWLPWGQRSVKSYRFMRSTCIPFHQLLLRAACSAEDLAASQLLHLCQAVMRLLHEEYGLRRAAKEEHVATGLMLLDSSHVSQLDKLAPDAGGVGAELLGCRRELEHIVGKPLLPDHIVSWHNIANSIGTGTCRDAIAKAELSRVTPFEGEGAPRRLPSEEEDYSAKGTIATAPKTRSFLEMVAGVASLPVKDCDTCRSCCAVSCFTCPHSIEHNCLECLGQQTCSCKLQVALIRFSLPVLWAIFDHLRTLFLNVCKREEDAAAQRQSSCAGHSGNDTACKEQRQRFHNVSSKAEVCCGGRDEAHAEERSIGSSLSDAAEHTQAQERIVCRTRAADDPMCTAQEEPASSAGAVTASTRTNQSFREQEDLVFNENARTADAAKFSNVKHSSGVSLCATRDPDLEATHGRPSEQGTAGSTSLPAAGEGESFEELLSQREIDAEMCVRDAGKVERRTPQPKRAHRSGHRRSRERLGSGGGQGHTRNKRKQDELLQDPLYIAMPSLEELVRFEKTALLLENFSKEYSKCRWEEELVNHDSVTVVDNGTCEDGRKAAHKEHDCRGAAKKDACFPGTRVVQGCTEDGKLPEETAEGSEGDFPLDAAAPSSVTFEEKRGSLFVKGENWSLTALVSCNEAEVLNFVNGEENRADVASEVVCEDGRLQRGQLTPKKPLGGDVSSHSSREYSPSTSSQEASTSRSSRQSSPLTYPLKSRRVAERKNKYTTTVFEREAARSTKEKSASRRKRKSIKNAADNLGSAEQMMTLVRQLTWRYFLSALKDEEEDNDERILPVFRKAGMPGSKHDIME